ncbi:MAG: aminotransferase class I/II-fold pyridoxal phosphate-dependent enzyme, partial [Chitinophagaceae bacterium]
QYNDAYALSDKLLEKASVFLTPGGIFGSNGNHYLRVSLCASEQKIEEAIQRISNRFK